MTKKKSNGEGSIYKRNDGKWCAQLTIGVDPSTGKLKRKFFYGKTKKEVHEKMINVQSKLLTGSYVESTKLTLSDWLYTWLDTYKKNDLRARTYQSYEYLIRIHINPHLGNIQLKNLNHEQIQNFYNFLSSKGRIDGKGGLSPKTIKNIHTLLHEVLEKAVQTQKIYTNVAKTANLPKKENKEIKILSKDDQLLFLKVVNSNRLGIAFIVSLATGLRVGELLGLRWEDVDMDNNILNVNQTIGRVKLFDENSSVKSKLAFGEPKTAAGKRSVSIPPCVTEQLKKHKKKQNEERLVFDGVFNEHNLVFCSQIGIPIDPKNLDRTFKSLLKKAELEKTNLHALRHTYATRLLEANEHPKTVQELLGHSTISTTLDIYSHVNSELKHSAAKKIEHLFTSATDTIIKESPLNYMIS